MSTLEVSYTLSSLEYLRFPVSWWMQTLSRGKGCCTQNRRCPWADENEALGFKHQCSQQTKGPAPAKTPTSPHMAVTSSWGLEEQGSHFQLLTAEVLKVRGVKGQHWPWGLSQGQSLDTHSELCLLRVPGRTGGFRCNLRRQSICFLISLSSISHFLFTIQKTVRGLVILVCGSHSIEIPAQRPPFGHFSAFSHGRGEARVCKAVSYENPTKIKILKLVSSSAVTAYRKHASLLRFFVCLFKSSFTLWMVPGGY